MKKKIRVLFSQSIINKLRLWKIIVDNDIYFLNFSVNYNFFKNMSNLMAVIDTLKYLRKGGKIPSVVAFAGEMLVLKPIVAIVDGEVKVVGKAMGLKKHLFS